MLTGTDLRPRSYAWQHDSSLWLPGQPTMALARGEGKTAPCFPQRQTFLSSPQDSLLSGRVKCLQGVRLWDTCHVPTRYLRMLLGGKVCPLSTVLD